MLLTLLCALLMAAPETPAEGRALRATLKTAERTIDNRVQQMTDRAPFVLLGSTRGAYLAGYGAVFSLEVNLVPVAGISPFRPAYSPQEIQNLNRQKRQKMDVLKAGLRQVMADQAAALAQLAASEKVAVVVSLFNFNWEDSTGLPSQVVFQATRQTLLDARRSGAEAIERAIDVREF